jgi:hypothetical protein
MAQGRRGAAPSSASYRNRVAQQQAVLDQLRSGGSINLYSSNPLAAGVEKLRNFLTGAEQPSAKATRLPDGREALMVPGGWGTDDKPNSALIPREVNVGGQRWFLGQQGQNAVYTRGPGLVGGQYGSIFPSNQAAPVEPGKTPPGAQPPAVSPAAKLSPEELAYNQERSRIAQLTEQNPEFQNIGQLRNNLRDQGMAIWAAKYGDLAKNVKPGQSGYEAIQKALYPGGAPLPAMSAESEAMLNAIAPPDATGVRPNVTPMPGQPPVLGGPSEAMFQAVTGGGSYITPMPKEAATPQTQAQDLAEAYRQAMLARILTNK